MHIDLIIPDLFLPPPPGGTLDIYSALHLPNTETLLARATRTMAPGSDLENYLLNYFDIRSTSSGPTSSGPTSSGPTSSGPTSSGPTSSGPTSSGIAALRLVADGGGVENHYWMCADPVHLQAQRDKLVLVCGELMAITRIEANALVEALNQHYADDDMKFFCPQPERWYVTTSRSPDLITHPLPQVAGQAINDRLPSGPDGKLWQQRMNEMQMLLHMHPVNLARDDAGLPILNSVWFWGGGTLPTLLARPARHCWADETLTRGLAQTAHCPTHPLPHEADAWLKNAAPDTKHGTEHLIVWDAPRRAAQYGDYAAWHASLMQFETQWAKPLLYALRDGRIDKLTLHAVSIHSVQTFSLNRAAAWRFWRRRKSLKAYAPAIS